MIFRRLLSHRGGASAAEFGIILPLFILFLLGIIDVGRWMYTYNRLEKATQMGARAAVVTDALSTAVAGSFLGQTCGGTTLQQGDRIPAACLTNVTCDQTACSPGGSIATYTTAFQNISGRMKWFNKEIQDSNVTIEYSQSGLGYAGNPNGPDVAPVVTVRLSGMTFTPLACELVGCSFTMPAFVSSLTFEDGVGAQSN